MKSERKNKLLKYLYPTDEIRHFMCNDLFFELTEIIPDKICISRKNLKNEVRKQNLGIVKEILNKFFTENETYKKRIFEIYNLTDINQAIELTLINYVFIKLFEEGTIDCLDVFSDKISICYSPISFLDMI